MTCLIESSVQANRWIRFDVDTRSFMTTDFVINELNAQTKAKSVSADLDTIMTDADTTNDTARPPSMALTDSHHGIFERTPRTLNPVQSGTPNDSIMPIRASTPMDLQTTKLPHLTEPVFIEPERNFEDTPMADIRPGKRISAAVK